MKPALNQQPTRTTNGTQNWTDGSITSDQTLQFFFGTEGTVSNTTTGQAKLFFGATDLTHNTAYAVGALDASAAGSANSTTVGSTSQCLIRIPSSGGELVAASLSAVLSNGITINQTASDAGAYLFNALSLAGSDHVVNLSSTTFATGDTSKVVTHGDSSAPELVIMFASVGATGTDVASAPERGIIAFWDGTNSVSASFKCSALVSPTDIAARINSDFGHQIDATDTDVATFSIGSVGSTQFTISRTATGTTSVFCTFISIRHTAGNFAAKCGVGTLPTSVSNVAVTTGMAVPPQVLMTVATRLTSTSLSTTDSAGSLSFGVSCNNNGTTQQYACAMTEQDGVTTTVNKCYTANGLALLSLDNTGTPTNKATVKSWDSGGVTLNHSTANTSAFQYMFLAFGMNAGNVIYTANVTQATFNVNVNFVSTNTTIVITRPAANTNLSITNTNTEIVTYQSNSPFTIAQASNVSVNVNTSTNITSYNVGLASGGFITFNLQSANVTLH